MGVLDDFYSLFQYVMDLNSARFNRNHRRCASLPEARCRFFQNFKRGMDVEMPVFSSSLDKHEIGHVVTGINQIHGSIPRMEAPEKPSQGGTKLCRSLPDLNDSSLDASRIRSKTMSHRLSPSILHVSYSEMSKKCEKTKEAKVCGKSETEERKTCRFKKKRPVRREEGNEWFIVQGKKEERKKTFMEDGGTSVLPMSTGYFPRPIQGQSLTSFLSSEQFSRASAELDRENAHFSISEAMISAIEQMKCNRQLRLEDVNEDDSDEEINRLKQRIRMRRRQRLEEKQLKNMWSANLLSDGKTDSKCCLEKFFAQGANLLSQEKCTPTSL